MKIALNDRIQIKYGPPPREYNDSNTFTIQNEQSGADNSVNQSNFILLITGVIVSVILIALGIVVVIKKNRKKEKK